MMKSHLRAPAVAVQMPIGQAHEFHGIVDLVEMNAVYFDEEGDKTPRAPVAIPDELLP